LALGDWIEVFPRTAEKIPREGMLDARVVWAYNWRIVTNRDRTMQVAASLKSTRKPTNLSLD